MTNPHANPHLVHLSSEIQFDSAYSKDECCVTHTFDDRNGSKNLFKNDFPIQITFRIYTVL